MFSKLKEETQKEVFTVAHMIRLLIDLKVLKQDSKSIETYNRRIKDFANKNTKITLDNLFQ